MSGLSNTLNPKAGSFNPFGYGSPSGKFKKLSNDASPRRDFMEPPVNSAVEPPASSTSEPPASFASEPPASSASEPPVSSTAEELIRLSKNFEDFKASIESQLSHLHRNVDLLLRAAGKNVKPQDSAPTVAPASIRKEFNNYAFPVDPASDKRKSTQTSVDLSPPPGTRTKSPLSKSFFKADEPVPSVEDAVVKLSGTPLVIKRLNSPPAEVICEIPSPAATHTFSWELLHKVLGGTEWSPGFYYVPNSQGECLLPGRAYYAANQSLDPYLPSKPGEHGAKLIPLIRLDSNGDDDPADDAILCAPLFIRKSDFGKRAGKNEHEYIYFGMYSQFRWSDNLDYERMLTAVPNHVKMHWAEQLSDISRPAWVTQLLKKHFCEFPEFKGYLDEKGSETWEKMVSDYGEELKEWVEEAEANAGSIEKEMILESFEKADADRPPPLRLWWEYLQCVDYDEGFYKMLVKEKERLAT